jgi:hypothetical protein
MPDDSATAVTPDHLTRLHLICVMRATGQISDFGGFGEPKTSTELMQAYAEEYVRLRQKILGDPQLSEMVPALLRGAQELDEFWILIKAQVSGYEARRVRLREEFQPLFDRIAQGQVPPEKQVSSAFRELNWQAVEILWRKALDRRESDPSGAITAAKSMVESVCRHILDSSHLPYEAGDDLPTLCHAASTAVGLDPRSAKSDSARRILGACTTAVSELAALRNKLGDAHGPGLSSSLTDPAEAALAVNLAGTVSTMLAQAWVQTSKTPSGS